MKIPMYTFFAMIHGLILPVHCCSSQDASSQDQDQADSKTPGAWSNFVGTVNGEVKTENSITVIQKPGMIHVKWAFDQKLMPRYGKWRFKITVDRVVNKKKKPDVETYRNMDVTDIHLPVADLEGGQNTVEIAIVDENDKPKDHTTMSTGLDISRTAVERSTTVSVVYSYAEQTLTVKWTVDKNHVGLQDINDFAVSFKRADGKGKTTTETCRGSRCKRYTFSGKIALKSGHYTVTIEPSDKTVNELKPMTTISVFLVE